jgi:hypothetical protein
MKIFTMNKVTILRIISIGAFIPAAISFILWQAGSLDIKTMAIINWIAFLVEFTAFLFVMKMKNSIRISQANVIIPKGSYEEKTIKAETNIFPNFLVPTNTYRNCIFRISLQIKEFEKHPLFYIIRKCERDTCTQELNKNIRLDPGPVHVFDIAIDSKEKLNFKFNEDVIIQKILIEELYMA